jgi:hypothetical protein
MKKSAYINNRYAYVYIISHRKKLKHYIGYRCSKIDPKKDLGIFYFGSSTNKEMKEDLKFIDNFRFSIIKEFDDCKKAFEFEQKLLKKYQVNINDKFYNKTDSNLLNLPEHVSCVDIEGNFLYVTKEEFDSRDDLFGVNKNKINGENNPNAKIIQIFNHNKVLVYEFNGNFEQKCKELNLPFASFVNSYKNNGRRLGHCYASRGGLRKTINQKYIGWFALIKGEKFIETQMDCNIIQEQLIGLHCQLTNLYNKEGIKNPNAKEYMLINAETKEKIYCYGNLLDTIKKLNISLSILRHNKGRYYYPEKRIKLKPKTFNTIGWKLVEI